MKKVLTTVLALAAALAFVAAPAAAIEGMPIKVGVQGNFGDDVDFGVGARVEYNLEEMVGMPIAAVGSFDYFFPGDTFGVDVTYWEINANAIYGIPVTEMITPYAGAGLNIAHASASAGGASASDTEFGANVLAGAKFDIGMMFTPFAEFRLELSGGEQWVVTGGVLF